jgi:hypothetical protein
MSQRIEGDRRVAVRPPARARNTTPIQYIPIRHFLDKSGRGIKLTTYFHGVLPNHTKPLLRGRKSHTLRRMCFHSRCRKCCQRTPVRTQPPPSISLPVRFSSIVQHCIVPILNSSSNDLQNEMHIHGLEKIWKEMTVVSMRSYPAVASSYYYYYYYYYYFYFGGGSRWFSLRHYAASWKVAG